MLAAAERGLDRVDWLISRIAAVVILLAMLLVSTDVVMRYAFHHPIFWVYDIVSIYILNLVVYLAVSEALRSGRHVSLGVRIGLLPPRLAFALRWLAWLVVAAFLCLLSWIAISATSHSVAIDEAQPGLVGWPLWLQKGIVALGLSVVSLRLVVILARAPSTGRLPAEEEEEEGKGE